MAKFQPYRPDLRQRADFLGLRGAMGGRMLPLLVAAMTFLAALAMAGAFGAQALAVRWQQGAATTFTVQVPDPDLPMASIAGTALRNGPEISRLARVMSELSAMPGIAGVRALEAGELADLLRPWLGNAADSAALPLPGVIEVHLAAAGVATDAIGARLDAIVPGTLMEGHSIWAARLETLAFSLQACAWLVLALVGAVSGAVIGVATQAGLAARRDAIEIVHGLGATDGRIAGRFANRAARLAGLGGVLGVVLAVPVLLVLAELVRPFGGGGAGVAAGVAEGVAGVWVMDSLPPPLLIGLPCLAVGAALIGFVTAQMTVRSWIAQLA
jgi:cell division transport system permease protein